ncbi:hypothetical protein V1477_014075 [Vespula maculifrons]|uniref:Uncharacterized protein n=1 Tax=Vespula maculifrons TaxID=7453 RepID=A0ABD2BLK3_VESMC
MDTSEFNNMPQFVGTRKLSIRVLLNEKRNGNRDAISRLSDEAPTISLGLFPSRFARREVIKQNIECLIVLVDERVPSVYSNEYFSDSSCYWENATSVRISTSVSKNVKTIQALLEFKMKKKARRDRETLDGCPQHMLVDERSTLSSSQVVNSKVLANWCTAPFQQTVSFDLSTKQRRDIPLMHLSDSTMKVCSCKLCLWEYHRSTKKKKKNQEGEEEEEEEEEQEQEQEQESWYMCRGRSFVRISFKSFHLLEVGRRERENAVNTHFLRVLTL